MTRTSSLPLLYGRPAHARGILPLVAGALAAGAGRAILGGVLANQQKQRTKGHVNAAYRLANERLALRQADTRQNTLESLNARGLIQQAMVGGAAGGAGRQPTTLGGQVQTDLEREFGLEQRELDTQRDRALQENKANYLNSLLGSAVSGAQTAATVYTGGKDLAAMRSMERAPTTIRGAFGVDPVHPWGIGAPGASSGVGIGAGQPNYDFRVNA